MGEMRNAYITLVGDPEGKRPLERPRCSWKDKIKTDLIRSRIRACDWIHLAQDRNQCQALVNTILRVRVP
jgi:hypothetical protein